MYQFPTDLYTDIRFESVWVTNILIENGEIKQNKNQETKGAMIRIFDGKRWYYSATTDMAHIQEEIDALAQIATPNQDIMDHPIIKKLEINKETILKFNDTDVTKIGNDDKLAHLYTYLPVVEAYEEIKSSKLLYKDSKIIKHIISSKGTDVTFDIQSCCVIVRYAIKHGDIPFNGSENILANSFGELGDHREKIHGAIKRDIEFNRDAVPVNPGVYTCVLSPVTTGVFAHESFGHKSEADFMIGDEAMKREWALGKQVGAKGLNIVDTGLLDGNGYVPFDDEGNRAGETYIIRDGILTGRLHSAYTAAVLEEELTGNARAINFEYEPIVRMTTTYIGAGELTKEELIQDIDEGILIDDLNHGSGMTTFTIAPSRAYMIRKGKLAEPVRVSVITGNVMKTLYNINGISKEFELLSFGSGGCGKMEQYPLPVGFGGPYIRVTDIQVQ